MSGEKRDLLDWLVLRAPAVGAAMTAGLYGEIDDAFDRWEWTIDRLVDGGDRVAVRGDFVGYGRGSGVKTELASGGTVMEISSRGKIARQEWFVEQNGWQRTLKAGGLSE